MPPPSQPCDPNDADDEGAVEVCLKLFKVSHHFLVYTFHQDLSAMTLLLTPSQSLLQSPLQLLSELPPNHELYLLEAKPEVKPTCTMMSQALASTAASSSATSSPLSTPCSTCSMKTKHDYISELQEQGCVEQAQTDHDALQLHEVCMACIEASTLKEKMRHERRVLKYQLCIEEAKAKTSQQPFFDTHNQANFDSNQSSPSPQYQTSQLGLGDNSFSSFNI